VTLKINDDKCHFFKKELKYLGHIVTNKGIKAEAEKVTAISDLTTPRTTKEVNSFLGMASWYRKFIPEFTKQASKRKSSSNKLGIQNHLNEKQMHAT